MQDVYGFISFQAEPSGKEKTLSPPVSNGL
jgi:hypothetical protein